MAFTLCNSSSINLNFLAHIASTYDKRKLYDLEKYLSKEELNYNLQTIWNNMVKNFRPIIGRACNSSFIMWDEEYLRQKDLYKALFKDTKEGYNEYLTMWNEYYNWWYKEGQTLIYKKSDKFIPIIYKLIKNKLDIKNIQLQSGNFSIQVILDEIPNGCLSSGTFFIIESINNISDDNLDKISGKLYELILQYYMGS